MEQRSRGRGEERLHLAAAKPSSVSIKQLHFVAFNFLNVEWEWQAEGRGREGQGLGTTSIVSRLRTNEDAC